MNFDVNNIKLVETARKFHRNGRFTTCEYSYFLKMPLALKGIFGDIENVCKATVKCHEDDVYSAKLGEKLALAKAEAHAYRIESKRMAAILHKLEDLTNSARPLIECFIEKAIRSENHNFEYIEWLTDDHEKNNEDDIDDIDKSYCLSERSCFAFSLYEAGLFHDKYADAIDFVLYGHIDDMWDLFEHRMVKNGYRSEKNEKVTPNKETSPAKILKSVLHAFGIDSRRDYHGDETVNEILRQFDKNLKKQGYDVN